MRIILPILLLLNLGFAKKVALVIGNSNYTQMEYLSSPRADAKAIRDKLKNELGFDEVILRYDLDEANMNASIKKFQAKLSQGDIGFFYYSGHGGQVDKESVLIPTSVDAKDLDSMRYHTLKVEEVLSRMSREGTALNLLVLDACREDTPTGSKGQTKGLGRIGHKPTGSLVLYSTAMGQTAKDSRLFNQVVLEKLGSAKYILNVANDISKSVYNQSGHKQKPEVLSSLVPDIRLGGGGYVPPLPPTPVPNPKGTFQLGNLMYQNQPFTKTYTWEEAKGYCGGLTLGNYNDWRLPTRAELNKLSNIKMYGKYDDNWEKWFDKNKHRRYKNSKNHYHFIKKEFIENMPEYSWFWTSESKDSSSAWHVYFNLGDDFWHYKTHRRYALCVR